MNRNELDIIKPGDKIKLTAEVIKLPNSAIGDFILKIRNTKMAVSPGALLEYGEHVRRKYKEHDLVLWNDEPALLPHDEYADGFVQIYGYTVKWDELTLLCPAEVVRKMKPWKGCEE